MSFFLLLMAVSGHYCRVVIIPPAPLIPQYTESMSCPKAEEVSAIYVSNGKFDSWVQKRSKKEPHFGKVVIPTSVTVSVIKP